MQLKSIKQNEVDGLDKNEGVAFWIIMGFNDSLRKIVPSFKIIFSKNALAIENFINNNPLP